MITKRKNVFIFVFFVVVLGIMFRFYNLSWGAPLYFHPDERNIASAITQLHFPLQMNPHFFAYGSFPIYLTYSIGVLQNSLNGLVGQVLKSMFHIQTVSVKDIYFVGFEQAILILRVLSFLLSSAMLWLLYKSAEQLQSRQAGVVAVILASFSVGFIQFAHFGTFETWLAWMSILLLSLSLGVMRHVSKKRLFFIGIVFGLLVGIKVSSAVFLSIPLVALTLHFFQKETKYLLLLRNIGGAIVIVLFVAGIVLFLTNPFVFFDYSSFLSSMRYESSVALGTLPVFYTGEFYQTTPILFQFLHIYPFLLNPLLTIVFVCSFFFVVFLTIQKKESGFLLLILFFLVSFLSQAFFFAKWTRYMVPTLPFMYLLISLALSNLLHRHGIYEKLFFLVIVIYSGVIATAFTKTAYGRQDTRVEASLWAKTQMPQTAKILSEVYDLGIVPFNANFAQITLFNFYDLDNGNTTQEQFVIHRDTNDYFILPSQRIMKTRLKNPIAFPIGSQIYQKLFFGTSGYQKIYETPCDILCKIAYMGSPVFSFEETVTVFDRPTVYIFRKK